MSDGSVALLSPRSLPTRTATLGRVLPMQRPLLALCVAYTLGLVAAPWWGLPAGVALGLGAGAALFVGALALAGKALVERFLLWMLAFFFVGLERGQSVPLVALPAVSGKVVVVGRVASGVEWFPDRIQVVLATSSLREIGKPEQPVQARLRVSILGGAGGAGESASQPLGSCPEMLPGDAVRLLAQVDVPRSSQNPGGMDRRAILARQGIDWLARVSSCAHLLVEPDPSSWAMPREIERARQRILRFFVEREGSLDAKGVTVSMVTGHVGLISGRVREDFQATGLSHLLAISGLQMGLVAMAVYFLVYQLLVRVPRLALAGNVRRISALLVAPVAVGYALLAGAGMPVIRSLLMVLCFLWASALDRRADPLHTLAAAWLFILGLWPQSLGDISFLLSFVAVASLILGVPALARAFRVPLSPDPSAGWPRRIGVRVAQSFLVTLAATLGTAPLVLYTFNQLSLVGPLTNLLAVPLTNVAVVGLGLIASLLLPVHAGLAGWCADLALGTSGWLCDRVREMASWPLASCHLPTPSLVETWALYAVLGFALLWGRSRWARRGLFAAALVAFVPWVTHPLAAAFSRELEVSFLDVGQGDAIFLRLPGGSSVLVDGGEARPEGWDAGKSIVSPFLWSQRISRLDVVAITHPDNDHLGGLATVIARFRPGEVWASQDLSGHPILEVIERAGSRLRLLSAGEKPLIRGNATISVLWPPVALPEPLDDNERSLVLKVQIGARAFLLTGDLEKQGEALLLSGDGDLRADVLKVGHHGSKQATSEAWLSRVQPRLAILSVRENNRYHLPNPAVLDRLERAGVAILRTDRDGAIRFWSDGESLIRRTQLP